MKCDYIRRLITLIVIISSSFSVFWRNFFKKQLICNQKMRLYNINLTELFVGDQNMKELLAGMWVTVPLLSLFQIIRNPVFIKNGLRMIRVGLGPTSFIWTVTTAYLQFRLVKYTVFTKDCGLHSQKYLYNNFLHVSLVNSNDFVSDYFWGIKI